MPNGKLDRQALPAPIAPEPVSPSTVSTGIPNLLEQRLLVIWRQVLGLVETPGVHDDFFDLGGHSLLAATLVHTIETELQVRLPLAALFRFSTVARLAESLSEQVTVSREAGSALPSAAPELSETLYRTLLSFHVGRRQARLAPDSLLMLLNPEAGGVPLYYCGERGALAAALPERPIIAMDSGVGAMAVTTANVQALADHYVRELLAQRLSGPFVLLGHSLGAWVAFEMAQRLLARGYAVPLLGLIDHPVDHPYVGRVAQFIADQGPFRKRCDTDAWRQACSQHFPTGMSLDYVPGNHVSILRQGAAARLLAERIEARLVQTARSIRPLAEDARRPCWQAPDEIIWAMDECATVTLSLTNVSMSVWGEEHDLAVGYHWYDDHQRLVEWVAGVQSLALPLSPGQTASLRYDIAAPGGPGRYRLVFDLLDRAGTWGSLSQSDSLAVAVEIQPPRVGGGDVESVRRAGSAGRDLETIRACERLLASRDSAPLEVFQQLVQALQRWGCPERALEQVQRGLATYPDDVQLHRLHAELALMLDQSDQAFEASRRLLDLESGQPANWALLAQACAQKGDHPAAIEAYRRALSQRAEFEWHKALANCLEQAGQFAAAATEWRQAVTLKPGLLPLAMRLAQTLRKSNQPQAALDVYRQVIDRDPEHLEGHRLAMDLLRELGRAEEALALLDAAPSGLASSARLQGARGDGLLALGRSEAALDAFRLGTQLDPRLAANWLKTANIQIQQGQIETAAITLDEGLRHNPDDIRLLLRRGGLLMNRERQPQQALTLFERVLAQRTNHFQAHWQRAEALARLGRWAEAESAYRSANRIDPLHAQAQAGLERVRAQMARLKTGVHS